MSRPISEIAKEIELKWKNVNYTARPYLDAMKSLNSINDKYYEDDGRSVVLYFLSNALTFRGDDARRLKRELQTILKGK